MPLHRLDKKIVIFYTSSSTLLHKYFKVINGGHLNLSTQLVTLKHAVSIDRQKDNYLDFLRKTTGFDRTLTNLSKAKPDLTERIHHSSPHYANVTRYP